jgi:hypothetical protein
MASTFCACSNDENEESAISGEAQIALIMAAVDGQIDNMYIINDLPDTYYITAEKAETAKALARTLTVLTWDGKAKSVKLNDNAGSINITSSSETAAYFSMRFSFNKTSFSNACDVTINLVNEAYLYSENAVTSPKKPKVKSVFSGKQGENNSGDDNSGDSNSGNSNSDSTSGN